MKTTDIEGTVIHGTLRNEDLIPAFMQTLDNMIEHGLGDNPEAVAGVGQIHERLGEIERRQSPEYYASEGAIWDLEWLFDTLDELAPDGYYFGAHPGDGSDFGFWPIEDETENH